MTAPRHPIPSTLRPTGLAAALAIALLQLAAPVAASTYGSLANFDVMNETGHEAHGFEIESEDASFDSSRILSIFGKNRSFGGVANYVVFDDITFGSATPVITGGVPEPSTWAMAILGMGLAGATLRRARRQRAVTA